MYAYNFAFVLEFTDTQSGYLFHETSMIPQHFVEGDLECRTLGIGHVDESGIIRTISPDQVDPKALAAFMSASNRLVQADRLADHRLAA